MSKFLKGIFGIYSSSQKIDPKAREQRYLQSKTQYLRLNLWHTGRILKTKARACRTKYPQITPVLKPHPPHYTHGRLCNIICHRCSQPWTPPDIQNPNGHL